MRVLTTLVVLPVLMSCAGATNERASNAMWEQFQSRLALLSGPDAMDCGHSARGEDGTSVISCVLVEHKKGLAFRASATRPGIDSFLVVGLAQNREGNLFEILGDSDIHGGSGVFAKPAIRTSSCTGLSTAAGNDQLPICVGRKEI